MTFQAAKEKGVDAKNPPNSVEFKTAVDAALLQATKKPRGRSGPGHKDESASNTLDTLVGILQRGAQADIPRTPRRSRFNPYASSPRQAGTPRMSRTPCSPSIRSPRKPPPPMSPAPARGSELRAFLSDLASGTGIFLVTLEDRLQVLDFTPDVLPEVDVARLQEVLAVSEGQVYKVKIFARKWSMRLEEKRNAGL
jgi:hypothetical protein